MIVSRSSSVPKDPSPSLPPLADSDSATWDLAPSASGGYIVTWLQGGILSHDSDSDAWDIAPAAAAAARCELMAIVLGGHCTEGHHTDISTKESSSSKNSL